MSLKAFLFGYKQFELHSDLQPDEAIQKLSLQVRPPVGAFASQNALADANSMAIKPEDHTASSFSFIYRGVVGGNHFRIKRDITSYLPGPGGWSPGPMGRHYVITGMSNLLLKSPAFIVRPYRMSWYTTEGDITPHANGCALNATIKQPITLTILLSMIVILLLGYVLTFLLSGTLAIAHLSDIILVGIFLSVIAGVLIAIAMALPRLFLNGEMEKVKQFLRSTSHAREQIYDHDFIIAEKLKRRARP
jgi:hypothetical protein